MLDKLKSFMTKENIDWFIVFMGDEHLSEYTGECDRYIAAISSFTGSAGTLVVTPNESYLFTDSRYHVQAEKQLNGKGITLMKCGLPQVPSAEEFVASHVWEGQCVAYDQKCVSFAYHEKLKAMLPESALIKDGGDILKNVCDLPEKEFSEISAVPNEYAGRTVTQKLEDVRRRIGKKYGDERSYTYLVSDLASIMWLFNIRSKDIKHVPVAYSYAIITNYSATLFVNRRSLSKEAQDMLEGAGVIIKQYGYFYKELEDVASDIVIADKVKNNCRMLRGFSEQGLLYDCADPEIIPKAVKNGSEIQGMKEAAKCGKLPDEYAAGKMLDDMRLKVCSDLSFSTICAYGENAAIVHYTAEEKSAAALLSKSFLLVDSGGQYEMRGTTDITRTISLGPLTDEEKKVYTLVLKGHLDLMDCVFPSGFEGTFLDGIAEKPLWDEGYFCGHGIGHGVGCYLCVHESEAGITRRTKEREVPITPGVIVSCEPGVYIEGRFGVRTENLLLATASEDTLGYKMCRFYPLTLVPYDKEAIIAEMLTKKEKETLKRYYDLIKEKISPLLEEKERSWLIEQMNLDF